MTRFSSPVFQHLVEVCLLSHRMMLSCDSTPIRSITDRPSLSPRSFTRSPIGLPCGWLSISFLDGKLRAYHVPRLCQDEDDLSSTPVVQHLRQGNAQPLNLTTHLLVQACQHLWPVLRSRSLRRFTYIGHFIQSWLPTASVLAVTTFSHDKVVTLMGKASLSQRLRTPPLPVTHALIGY